MVVTSGTARGILNREYLIPVAGKTWTVQTRSFERFANKSQHAWFIGYGPFNGTSENTIVTGIFVEKGVAGSIGAAPSAHDIFALWSQRLRKGVKLE
jgi:penicillin-binding protein 2